MELKKRQACILRSLLETETGLSVRGLLEHYGIAKRTLYYDLQKINDWLQDNDLGSTVIVGQIVMASINDQRRLEKRLGKEGSYFFSIAERHSVELLYIALNHETVTINKLKDYFDLSKNTILMDIKNLKEELEQKGLSLESSIKSGYVIKGEEAAIRKLIGIQIRLMWNSEGLSSIKKICQESLQSFTGNEIDFFELCNCVIRQYEIDAKDVCILSDVNYESLRMQAALIRSMQGYEIYMSSEEKYALMNTLSYRSLEISAQKLKLQNIIITPEETYYLASLLLGIQTTDFFSQDQEDSYISEVSTKVILNFERIACLYFADREHLRRQLIHHIRPLYYRMKYAVPAENLMVSDIKRLYPLVFDITRRSLEELDMDFPKIPDEELAYLCVYMASNLKEEEIIQGSFREEKNILIIGPKNMATAILVKEQLEKFLGRGFKYHITSFNNVREWMLKDYILVAGVGNEKGKNLKCDHFVRIGTVITEEAQKKIIEILKKNQMVTKYDQEIQDIISIVARETGGMIEESKLYFELFRYFNNKEQGQKQEALDGLFSDKIKEEEYVFLPHHMDWKSTVLRGAMELQKYSGNLYGKMMNLLSGNRLHTYRLCEEVLLVHYPMQGDEFGKVDVSIMVSEDGVECADGKLAYIIVGLSTVDNYEHWSVLQEIFWYFEIQDHVDGIRKLYKSEKE